MREQCDLLEANLAGWKNLNEHEVRSLNQSLAHTKIAALPSTTVALGGCKL